MTFPQSVPQTRVRLEWDQGEDIAEITQTWILLRGLALDDLETKTIGLASIDHRTGMVDYRNPIDRHLFQ